MTETMATVISVNISVETGTVKQPVPEIVLNERGIEGDAHAGAWHRQVSILSRETIDDFETEIGRKIEHGEFAENLTIEGVDLRTVGLLDRFTCSSLDLEVTQIGKECHGDTCAIFREVGKCVMPHEGIFCRVLDGGDLKAGDNLVYRPYDLRFRIITLSDRASVGEYEDRSGPAIADMLGEFFNGTRWHPTIDRRLLPDDQESLSKELAAAHNEGCDVIFTCGGTGLGPRDIAPETVTDFCDKLVPGIMEFIRVKYGADKPNALLSRSVAGVRGQTLVYALPGSVKAGKEYIAEILKTLDHAILTVHGIDAH